MTTHTHLGALERLEVAARGVAVDCTARTIYMFGAAVTVTLAGTVDHVGRSYRIPQWQTNDDRAAYIVRVLGGDAIVQRVIRDQHPDITTWPGVM